MKGDYKGSMMSVDKGCLIRPSSEEEHNAECFNWKLKVDAVGPQKEDQ